MKKSTRLNILFAIIILLAAGVLWLCFGHPAAGSGLVAVLTYGDDSTQLRIPLDTDHRYDIDTGYYTIHLVVENGGIRFVESPARTTPVNPWRTDQTGRLGRLPARPRQRYR